MLFKEVLIGLEIREFDSMCPIGKNQSYEVLTPDQQYVNRLKFHMLLITIPLLAAVFIIC